MFIALSLPKSSFKLSIIQMREEIIKREPQSIESVIQNEIR